MVELYKHQADELEATKNMNKVAVKGYEGLYAVDIDGNVYSLKRTTSRRITILKQYENGSGYKKVNLYDANGKCSKKYVHRLVAEAFVPNPNNYQVVNHIDCDKSNNRCFNLEWCTQKHNIQESMKNGLQKHDAVVITGKGIEKWFYSMRAASLFLGKAPNFISLKSKKNNPFYYDGYRIEVISS